MLMPAYIVVEVSISDHEDYEEYKRLTPASIAAYDGRFIVRTTKTEPIEGGWQPERFVILEFPSKERAKEWWNSTEYAKAKAIRQRAAKTKMLLAEGF
jgi:uncharacterized protein (DUF1330 family)